MSAGLVKHESPSVAVASIVVAALIAAIVADWREDIRVGGRAVLLLLAVTAAGMKGSALPVVVAGALTASAIAIVVRPDGWRRVVLDTALTCAALAGSVLLLFGGSAQEIRLSPALSLPNFAPIRLLFPEPVAPGILAIAFGTLLLVVAVLSVAGGLVAAAGEHTSLRRRPEIALLVGTGLAGALGAGWLWHAGGSQSYFLRNAIPALAVASGVGIAAVWARPGDQRHRVLLGAVGAAAVWLGLTIAVLTSDPVVAAPPLVRVLAGVAAVGVAALVTAGATRGVADGRRAAMGIALVIATSVPTAVSMATEELPQAVTIIPPDRPQAFSGDQIEAARWLRDHSGPDDLVATNRHCGNPRAETCDNRRFFVAAYTERQVLVEGWGYTPTVVELAAERGVDDAYVPYWRPEVLELNDRFLTSPTPEDARALWDLGVRWLFIDEVVGHAEDFGDLATERYATKYATVYELEEPAAEETG